MLRVTNYNFIVLNYMHLDINKAFDIRKFNIQIFLYNKLIVIEGKSIYHIGFTLKTVHPSTIERYSLLCFKIKFGGFQFVLLTNLS